MRCARASPIPESSAASANSSLQRATRCACARERPTNDVLARVQSRRDDPSAAVGHCFSAGAIRDSILLQLLVRLFRAGNLAQLELAELSAAGAQSNLFAGAFPFDADRGFGHGAG